ncbi:thioesterase family protein [Aquisalimonas lutea]|uniref:acyl-CoA thioesterase n=1 Tax=Aquisalimonas lutea TaxID=1327750 RepID=UPI0025B2BBED|nr:thioesterase family protein [Aquisalimonas lutea]MDN3516118.1 thioesterase family protein [Aquisalimonas lutea]
MNTASAPARADYRVFYPITTRWMDNDLYGHVNNVTYYAYFDTAVNQYLVEEGGLDIHNGPVVGFVVRSSCSYLRPVAFPERIEAGVRVEHLGNSSVQYGVGIFREGDPAVCAHGEFVHVFVDRAANRSVPIPDTIRAALERLRTD